MAFNLDDYEPVENRITSFWVKYPAGRIITSIVAVDEKMIVMKAEIFTDREDPRPATVDFAQEYIGGSKLTMNSWLEVCATSAIGRALADLDFVKTKGKRPSREEMKVRLEINQSLCSSKSFLFRPTIIMIDETCFFIIKGLRINR